MGDACGIIVDTIGKPICGVHGAKEERRKECEGPGPSRGGSVELGTGEGSRCEIRQQRVLRSARHRAGQIRDAAPSNRREGFGSQRDGGIRRVKADILPDQDQLRGSGDRWPGAQEARSARAAQTSGRSVGVYSRATGGGRSLFQRASWPGKSRRISTSMSTRGPSKWAVGVKKTADPTPTGVHGPGRLAGVVSQYEALRNAALGHPLPRESRYGSMSFFVAACGHGHGLWLCLLEASSRIRASSIVELRHAERNQIRHSGL